MDAAAQIVLMPVMTGTVATTVAGIDLQGQADSVPAEQFGNLLLLQVMGQAEAGMAGTEPVELPLLPAASVPLPLETAFITGFSVDDPENDQATPATEYTPVMPEQLPLIYGQLAALQTSSPLQQQEAVFTAVDAAEPDTDAWLTAVIGSVEPEQSGEFTQEPMYLRHVESAGVGLSTDQAPKSSTERPQIVVLPTMSRAETTESPGRQVLAPPEHQKQQQPEQGGEQQGGSMVRQAAVIRQQSGDSSVPEVAVSGKQATAVVPQPFRFAQTPDVAVAATDTGGRQEQTAQQQSQSSPDSGKLQMAAAPQAGKQQQVSEGNMPEQAGEHHHAVAQTGRTVRTAPEQAVPEQHRPLADEQVARQVAERLSSYEIKQGSDRISLRLSPEHLGNLQLNLRMEEQGGLKLEIIAEHRGVREALLRQGDELRETLARQNIRIESFEVSTGTLGGQTEQQFRGWRQMNPEQRVYHAQYAAAARTGVGGQEVSPQVRYFEPQYNSTIDVRF